MFIFYKYKSNLPNANEIDVGIKIDFCKESERRNEIK